MSNKVNLIRKWMQENPSPTFTDDFEDSMIERFLYACENDVNRTKKAMLLFFGYRAESPEIFANRDPSNKGQRNIFDVVAVYPLPKKTPEGYQVYISHLLDASADKFDFLEYCRMFFNISDVRMKTEEKIPTADIPVFDMSGFNFKHLLKLVFSPTMVKKYMRITQEAHPVYLKHIHVINASPILEKVLTLVRPLMKEEVRRLIHVHCEGSDSIFEYIPRNVMPPEFGGEGASMNEIKVQWRKLLDANREWLMTDPWRGKIKFDKESLKDYDEPESRIELVGASSDTFKVLNLD